MNQQDYIELLSGYLINHFRSYPTYEEGVQSAIKEVTSDLQYLEEMKSVFLYFLESKDLEKNLLKNIVRSSANYFVSNDTNALKKLQFIYEDTILRESNIIVSDEVEEVDIVFDPNTMNEDDLIENIFSTSLEAEVRINAALLLRGSGDSRFVTVLLQAIQEGDSNVRYGLILVLLWGDNWEGKFTWLSNLLVTDTDVSIRKSIAYYLGKHGNDIAKEEEIIATLLTVIQYDSHEKNIKNYLDVLKGYKVVALKEMIESFDFNVEKNQKIFSLFLNKLVIDESILDLLLDVLKSAPSAIQLSVLKHIK